MVIYLPEISSLQFEDVDQCWQAENGGVLKQRKYGSIIVAKLYSTSYVFKGGVRIVINSPEPDAFFICVT